MQTNFPKKKFLIALLIFVLGLALVAEDLFLQFQNLWTEEKIGTVDAWQLIKGCLLLIVSPFVLLQFYFVLRIKNFAYSIAEDGFVAKPTQEKTIPWSSVERITNEGPIFKTNKIFKKTGIFVKLKADSPENLEKRKFNLSMFAYSPKQRCIALSPFWLDASYDELKSAILKFAGPESGHDIEIDLV